MFIHSLGPVYSSLLFGANLAPPFTGEVKSALRYLGEAVEMGSTSKRVGVTPRGRDLQRWETGQGSAIISPSLNADFLFGEQETRQRRQPTGPRANPCWGGGSTLVKGGPCVQSWGAPAPGSPPCMPPLQPEEAAMELE